MTSPAAAQVLALLDARTPTLGALRLICIDGPAGAGKTTLAGEIAAERGLATLHLDDLYPGWKGLDDFEPAVEAVLDDLAAGRSSSYARYDWYAETYLGRVGVPADRDLILEGVGAGNEALAAHATVLVWVEAPPKVCDARWLARDGELMTTHARAWRQAEARLFARERTRDRADLVVVSLVE